MDYQGTVHEAKDRPTKSVLSSTFQASLCKGNAARIIVSLNNDSVYQRYIIMDISPYADHIKVHLVQAEFRGTSKP